jgi:hypothetical protein
VKTHTSSTFKKPIGLFAGRPTLYICIVLGAILLASAYKVRKETIFSCPATLYKPDRYIAYCNGAAYADYEHGAFWFDLEPPAQTFARNADVLFLGNSRLQFAFSTAATADWLSAASAQYYLLGFTYQENVVFAEGLLQRILPKARVYVINVDNFFDRWETPPAKVVMHDPNGRNRYVAKRFWQRLHEPICTRLPAFCGNQYVFFRSRETGTYSKVVRPNIAPVSYDQTISEDLVSSNTAAAEDFLSHLPVERKCVIMTTVPTVETKIGNVNAITAALGENLIAPEVPGLETFDRNHLDQPSAERWSRAFFQLASPRIRSCLERQRPATPVGSL